MAAGPSSAPDAPNSFTSPAPVAPKRCPGSISATPIASPASDPARETRPIPAAATARPAAASESVSAFGTRRVFRSIAAAAQPAAAMVPITITSDGLTNAAPEHVVNRGAQRADSRDGDHGDQRRQQAVLEQILALGALRKSTDCHKCPFH